MKFVLNLTFAVLIAGVCAASSEDESSIKPVLTQKQEIRHALQRELYREHRSYQRHGIQLYCPRNLSPEEIVFGDEKIEKFLTCGNATIDLFISKLDDNFNFEEVAQHIDKISGPLCEIFDDIFRCVGEISPVIDLCLTEREKIFKNKVFALVPLIQQTVCLRNGGLIAQIMQQKNSERCIKQALEMLFEVGLIDVFDSASTELFGDQTVCQRFNDVLKQVYTKVGECSSDVLEGVKDMLGFFCEGTHCERYVHDLQCY